MRAHVCLFDHPVYQSLYETFSHVDGIEIRKLDDFWQLARIMYRKETFQIRKLDLCLSREDLYILNSPVVCLEAWDALLHGVSTFIVEEYFARRGPMDSLVGLLLLPFRKYPFISFTKRTRAFLARRSFRSFLIPPAERKRIGSKKRDSLLYVSKMMKSKRPFLVLELARRLNDEHFVLVGRGPLLPEVKEKAKSMPNVEIVEFVETREELFRGYYAKAKALIHPAERDPVGFVVVEALASSTPVLASVGVGASDYLPEAWRVATYDIGEWVRKIRALNDEDVEVAERTFEQENLNIESPYFKQTAQRISSFLAERGWP